MTLTLTLTLIEQNFLLLKVLFFVYVYKTLQIPIWKQLNSISCIAYETDTLETIPSHFIRQSSFPGIPDRNHHHHDNCNVPLLNRNKNKDGRSKKNSPLNTRRKVRGLFI